MQKETFYQKIPAANEIFRVFYKAYMIFNLTFNQYSTVNFIMEKKRLASFAQHHPDLG
jgi:hypothetical protein